MLGPVFGEKEPVRAKRINLLHAAGPCNCFDSAVKENDDAVVSLGYAWVGHVGPKSVPAGRGTESSWLHYGLQQLPVQYYPRESTATGQLVGPAARGRGSGDALLAVCGHVLPMCWATLPTRGFLPGERCPGCQE